MRGLPVNQFGKGSQESRKGSRARHSVLRQLATLETMSLEQLHEQWRDLYGGEPPRYKRDGSSSSAWPIASRNCSTAACRSPPRRVCGKSPRATRWPGWTSRVSGNHPELRQDILPGTRFVRIWKDRRYEVLAHPNGFEYEGRIFRSLSAVAREITGTRWNGRLFFGLKKRHDARRPACLIPARTTPRRRSSSTAPSTPARATRTAWSRNSTRWMPSGRRPRPTSKASACRAGARCRTTTTTVDSPAATWSARDYSVCWPT